MNSLTDLAGTAVFATSVILTLMASGGVGPPGPRVARARRWLIVFLVLVTASVGISQRALWPYSDWSMDSHTFSGDFSVLRVVAIDAEGGEHPVDPAAFAPVDWWDIYTWLQTPRGNAAFSDAAPWLLDRLRSSRKQVDGGGRLGSRLGMFGAPPRTVLRARWLPGDDLAGVALQGLRVYEYFSRLDGLPPDPAKTTRTLRFEFLER